MAAQTSTTTHQPSSATVRTGGQQQQQQHSSNIASVDGDEINAAMLSDIDTTTFEALSNIDLDKLCDKNLNCVLPYLVKLLLSPSFTRKKEILRLIYPIDRANGVMGLMQSKPMEPHDFDTPANIEDFEWTQSNDRLKIVLSEYLRVRDSSRQPVAGTNNQHTKLQSSDLFDNPLYIDDVFYSLFALLNKPMAIAPINLLDVVETLLHLRFGPIYIIRLIANMPDRCLEVCRSMITLGEKQDEGASFNEISDQRARTLRAICLINPSISFTIRALTLQLHKMPSLTLMITSDHMRRTLKEYKASEESKMTDDEADSVDDPHLYQKLEDSYDSAVAFMAGIFLGIDEDTRIWFAQYTKATQQKRIDQGHHTILTDFRSLALEYIQILFPMILSEDESLHINDQILKLKLNKKLIQAIATLRLYCALRGIGAIKLNHEESETLLQLITCRPMANQTSVNFASTGVCTILACSSMLSGQKEERRAAEWLRWLIKESNFSDCVHSSHGKCSISELLLLIAIHFQNNQTAQIGDLVCATLGMKLQLFKASVTKCKPLFVQEVFNDQMIAEHAVKVPVTKNLSDNITEFLPIHCVHQLLESRSFSKHQVPIQDWIYHQICESKKPIHRMLPKLIEAYVNSLIISTSVYGHCGTNQPIPQSKMARIFRHKLYSSSDDRIIDNDSSVNSDRGQENSSPIEDMDVDGQLDKDKVTKEPDIVNIEVAQILSLYYMLLYEEGRMKKNDAELTDTERSKLIRYSADLMMDIPVFYLLQLVRDNQDSFGTILPDLLKLVASQYPQLCSTQHWLSSDQYEPYKSRYADQREEKFSQSNLCTLGRLGLSTTDVVTRKRASHTFIEELKGQLVLGFGGLEKDPTLLSRAINSTLSLPRDEIWIFVEPFIENWPKLLDINMKSDFEHEKLIRLAAKLWWKFNTVFPRKLWVMTVNALRRLQDCRLPSAERKALEYSWDELAFDPLIVLRCDSRVFRCPETLNIVLHVLSAFLAASKRNLQDQVNEQLIVQREPRAIEELKTTLVLAQSSAAIQILLESCLHSENERPIVDKKTNDSSLTTEDKVILERYETSVNCICEHLHQVFISDTNLAKLVHFQTYPSELLTITSEKIPSMHICLDFIPELMSQPDSSKQVFVIELTSHLCEKYAITKSLNVAKLCFNVSYTLLQILPSDRRAQYYIPVLPALLRICKVFPILQEDARIILDQLNEITLAHLASTSSRLGLASDKPFSGLERLSWRDVMKLMQTLSLNESLYLCIRKCMLDLDGMKQSTSQEPQMNGQGLMIKAGS